MIRPDIAKEEHVTALETLRQRVAELENLEIDHQADMKLIQVEDEQRYKAIFESANDIILLIGKKGTIIDVNERLKEIGGYEREELIGKNIGSLANIMTKKSLAIVLGNFLKRVVGVHVPRYEIEMIKKNGELVTIEISARPLKKDGKIIGDLAILRDVTERKQTEKALKASEENFRNSIASSSMGIRVGDIGEQTFYVNQAFLDIFGYKNIDEVSATPPSEFYAPKSFADSVLRKEKLERGEKVPDQIEVDITRKDGMIRHLQISRRDIFWNGKQESQIIYHDITERKQMEEALKASEQNFRNSIASSSMGIRITDKDDHTLYANRAFLGIFGYDNIENIKAFSTIDYYTPEEYARYLLRKEKRERGEPTPDTFEIDIKRKDGTIRHLQIFRNEIFWNGETRYQNFYNDITERKQMEEALKASEQNFRNSLDGSLMGIRIVDAEWHTLYVNKEFLDIFGFNNIDEVKRTSLQDCYTPKEHARYLQRKEKRELGESVPDNPAVEIVSKDGTIHFVKVYLKEVLWNGKQQRQLVYHNVTEQKQAQQKIERSAQEWRTTFDSITDLISIQGKDNRIIRVNKAVVDLLHTTPQELVGKFCREVMRGNQECPTNCPHLLAIKTGKPSSIETFNSNLGLHLQESASPLFNEKGEITGTVLVARDVTQQKRIEEQLILTDRLASIGELSSGIAHELNNPLTSVIGFSQLLMEGDAPENIKKDLGIVYNEAQRAAVIVKNLLTFARKHAPVKQLSQVNTVIEDVLRLRAYEQKVNNIEVETRLAPGLPEIMIDHFQMQQVFLNIVVNGEFAMQEAHHRGKMVITTERLDSVIRITFTDDGPGISEENLKHIFDPFFTTKEVGKGTGLGLSICHGIVMEHRGKIYASNEKGMGASFIVELPLINEQ